MKMARQIEYKYDKGDVLTRIAIAKGDDAKLFSIALAALKRIPQEYEGSEAAFFRNLAVAMAKAGMFKKALKTARMIETSDEDKIKALADIAVVKGADIKVFDEAIRVTSEIEDSVEKEWQLRSSCYDYLVDTLLGCGLLDLAIKTSARIEDPDYKAMSSARIGVAKGRDEKWLREALEQVDKIEFSHHRAYVLNKIVKIWRGKTLILPCPK
jgi:hypothetical protein